MCCFGFFLRLVFLCLAFDEEVFIVEGTLTGCMVGV